MTNKCPFCGNYAYAAPVGDAYRMDCRYCEIQVEITKRAYAARCPNPVAVLDYIREKMKSSTRPRVDILDMKRTSPAPATEEEMTNKDQKAPETDALTTAAKAIGSTLGRIAVKTGIAKPPAPDPVAPVKKAAGSRKKAAAGKVPKPKPAAKKKTPIGKTRKAAPARKNA